MHASRPKLSDYMTNVPQCLGVDTALEDVLLTMSESNSRYLPVISGKQVVGILNNGAARWAASLLGSEAFTAADLMSPAPAIAAPSASLYEVLDATPTNPYGCTVVQDEHSTVVGIFTPREVLSAMRDLAFQGRKHRAEGITRSLPRVKSVRA